jgi:hypothetical protein
MSSDGKERDSSAAVNLSAAQRFVASLNAMAWLWSSASPPLRKCIWRRRSSASPTLAIAPRTPVRPWLMAARISHKVGVVTAQNGPAATLLVAPLAEALTASVPVVALVQDVALGNFDLTGC